MTETVARPPMVKAEQVHKAFGHLEVLKGIDLEVAEREVMCIIGPSGSGKSTALRTINGLTPVTSGTVHVGGVDVTSPSVNKVALRHHVGMVFQQYNLFPHKTVLENVAMAPIQVLRQPRREGVASEAFPQVVVHGGLTEKL